jgi:hypothetical protein
LRTAKNSQDCSKMAQGVQDGQFPGTVEQGHRYKTNLSHGKSSLPEFLYGRPRRRDPWQTGKHDIRTAATFWWPILYNDKVVCHPWPRTWQTGKLHLAALGLWRHCPSWRG